jgi:hypothetical protein
MKDGVVIINTARGGCVNEEDMVAQLKSGKVRAYATDVFLRSAVRRNCPLYDAPNVIMTPHLGASSSGEHAPHRRRRGPHPRRLRAPHGLGERHEPHLEFLRRTRDTLPLEALERAKTR